MEMQQGQYHHSAPFPLELGGSLTDLQIAYHTYGTRNNDDSNVIWVCHALTANSDPCDWWTGLFGTGHFFDPKNYFIVCANIIGSCYGSTGPQSINPETGRPYYASFPTVTIRDMVEAHRLLQQHLGITPLRWELVVAWGLTNLLEWMAIDPSSYSKRHVMLGHKRPRICLGHRHPHRPTYGNRD
jgi:homoserine O-acetyltransferase